MKKSALSVLLLALALPAVLAQRPGHSDDDDGDHSPSWGSSDKTPGKWDVGTNRTICSDCRNGGPSCPKSLRIPAWFSHSFTVTGDPGTFNVWNYLAATEDPTDDLITAIVDPSGGIYTKTYNDQDSCQAEVNFRTQENRNRLVLKCDNWFFACNVHLQYSVAASTLSGASGAGSTGPIASPTNSTGNETAIASAINAPATDNGTSASPAVIGLAVGLSLLGVGVLAAAGVLFARKRKAKKEATRNAALESATNISPADQSLALSAYPGEEGAPYYPAPAGAMASYSTPTPSEPAPSYLADEPDYAKVYGYNPRDYGYIGEIPMKPAASSTAATTSDGAPVRSASVSKTGY